MKRKAGNRKRGKLLARKQRVARGIGASDRTRLTVYRSARHIYALLVDPESGRTIASTSTRSKAVAGGADSTGRWRGKSKKWSSTATGFSITVA
jgi:large subunit ribosomal protein L18